MSSFKTELALLECAVTEEYVLSGGHNTSKDYTPTPRELVPAEPETTRTPTRPKLFIPATRTPVAGVDPKPWVNAISTPQHLRTRPANQGPVIQSSILIDPLQNPRFRRVVEMVRRARKNRPARKTPAPPRPTTSAQSEGPSPQPIPVLACNNGADPRLKRLIKIPNGPEVYVQIEASQYRVRHDGWK